MVKKVVKTVGKKVQNIMRKGAKGVKKVLKGSKGKQVSTLSISAARQEEKKALMEIRRKALKLFKTEYVKRTRLDKSGRDEVTSYTGSGYVDINRAMRSGNVDAKLLTRIDAILRVMSKPEWCVYKGTVYRGVNLPKEITGTLLTGATFRDPEFLSSSTEKEKAFTRGDDCILFVITCKTGKHVGALSKHKHESEVLFRPSTMFKIKSVESGVVPVVTMEEIVA